VAEDTESSWEEKLKDPEQVKQMLENLNESEVISLGVSKLYELLEAKIKAFEKEKFGEFSFTRQGEQEKYPEYHAMKADILDYAHGSTYKLSANGILQKTKAISKKIDSFANQFENEKEKVFHNKRKQKKKLLPRNLNKKKNLKKLQKIV